MIPVAFIDANIPIYAAGRNHPYREPCAQVLRMVALNPDSFITNAEVLQKLLHRYLASGRWTLGREVVSSFAELMQGLIEPVYAKDILLAANLADTSPQVSARDLVHAAVMRRLQVRRIISADQDFDRVDGIERLDPIRMEEWQAAVIGTGNE